MDTAKTPERRLVRPAALLAALSALGLTFSLMVGPALAQGGEGEADCPEGTTFVVNILAGDLEEGLELAPGVTITDITPDTGEIDSITIENATDVDIVIALKGGSDQVGEAFTIEANSTETISLSTDHGISNLSVCAVAEESTEASVESIPPSVESVPPSVESVPPSVESVPPSVESVPPSVESVPPSVESVPPSVEESTEASVEVSTEASVEGSVLGNTGTPEPSTPDTAFGSDNGPSPLPTIVFGAILLASLAGLAWVNVQAVRTRS